MSALGHFRPMAQVRVTSVVAPITPRIADIRGAPRARHLKRHPLPAAGVARRFGFGCGFKCFSWPCAASGSKPI